MEEVLRTSEMVLLSHNCGKMATCGMPATSRNGGSAVMETSWAISNYLVKRNRIY